MSSPVSTEELSLAELEARVHRGDREARSALLTIAREVLYLQAQGEAPDSAPKFTVYAQDRFGYAKAQAYRLLRVAALEDALADNAASPIGD